MSPHQEHTHPFLGPFINTTNGEFTIPDDGELDPIQWYRIHFEAMNVKGLSSSIYVDIQPDLASFALNTDPEGLTVLVDAVETVTPTIITGVKGTSRYCKQFYENSLMIADQTCGGTIESNIKWKVILLYGMERPRIFGALRHIFRHSSALGCRVWHK